MPQRTPGLFRKLDAIAVLTGPLLPVPQDDTRADRQSPAHVRRLDLHHGRDRRLVRRHPDDDLPAHQHPAGSVAGSPYPLIFRPVLPAPPRAPATQREDREGGEADHYAGHDPRDRGLRGRRRRRPPLGRGDQARDQAVRADPPLAAAEGARGADGARAHLAGESVYRSTSLASAARMKVFPSSGRRKRSRSSCSAALRTAFTNPWWSL
jgi:hypothetical protein